MAQINRGRVSDPAQAALSGSHNEAPGSAGGNLTLPQTVTMIEMIFLDQTNHYGVLFGGQALRLMDKAAFVTELRYTRCMVATACSERVDCRNAVHRRNLIELTASVISSGRSSMTLAVSLLAEDLLSGKRE